MPMFNDKTTNDYIEQEGAQQSRRVSEGEIAWYFRKRKESGNPINIPKVENSKLPGDEI